MAANQSPITMIAVTGPDDDVMLALSTTISQKGRLGVTSGPFKNAPHPLEFVIFVGKQSPVIVGETAQTRDAERQAAAMKKSKQTAKP